MSSWIYVFTSLNQLINSPVVENLMVFAILLGLPFMVSKFSGASKVTALSVIAFGFAILLFLGLYLMF